VNEHPNNETHEPLVPPAVREALDDLRVAPARAEFRDALRSRFVDAGAVCNRELSELEAELVEGELPAAAPAFREDLRARFLEAGAELRESKAPAAATAPAVQPRPAARAQRRTRRAPQAEPARGRLLTLPRALVAVAAAAALLIALFVLDPGGASVVVDPLPASRWQPVEYAEGSGYVVDGVRFAANDGGGLDEALTEGDCRLETESADLSVIWLEEGVMLEFAKSSEIRVLPRPEGEHGLIEIEVLAGGVRVATTEQYPGRVLVHTPDMTIALSGHSLGVDVYSSGTCLCVLEGTAQMTLKSADGEESLELLSDSTTFVQRGAVLKSDSGVHHAEEMESFRELGRRYLY